MDGYALEAHGAGASARILRARDIASGRRVVLKIGDARSRLRREAAMLARLRHPGIVALLHAELAGKREFLVLEDAGPGDVLAAARAGASLGELLERVLHVLDTLAFVHAAGAVHGDLKPAHVILDDGRTRLIDFGAARLVWDGRSATAPGEIAGTIDYMAPEIFLGIGIDRRTDLYSLGASLYEVLTGTVPFAHDSEDVVASVYAHVRDRPPVFAERGFEIAPELERIVMKLLAKNPAERHQSAGELAGELRRFAATHRTSQPVLVHGR